MNETVTDRVRSVMDAASMSQAAFAERIGLTPDKLSKSLKGVRRFTSLDLALIAEVGGRTVDWLLTGREPLQPALAARRRVETLPGGAGVDDATRRFAAAYEVLDLLGRSFPLPKLPSVAEHLPRYVDQGEKLAADALERLECVAGLTSMAELGTDALIAALEESFGVDVAITDLPEEVDGLAWQSDAFRLILLGPTDLWTRQRFTLAHELGHILARDAQQLLVEKHVAPGRQMELTEARANVFAANLLMPAQEVRDAFHAAVADSAGALPDDAFNGLVVRFKVSPSALAARLHQLALITADRRRQYRGFRTEMCHLLTGAADAYQRHVSWASARRFPSRIASELFMGYVAGETTLRPLASLLKMDVDELHDLLDPAAPLAPEPPATGADEGDLVFQP